MGYLLKDRVNDLDKLAHSLQTVAAGGTVLDHEVVEQLLARRRQADPLVALTAGERDVLRLMGEGRSNNGIAEELLLSAGSVEKYISGIFTKLGLLPAAEDHRRVLAVLAWLRATYAPAAPLRPRSYVLGRAPWLTPRAGSRRVLVRGFRRRSGPAYCLLRGPVLLSHDRRFAMGP